MISGWVCSWQGSLTRAGNESHCCCAHKWQQLAQCRKPFSPRPRTLVVIQPWVNPGHPGHAYRPPTLQSYGANLRFAVREAAVFPCGGSKLPVDTVPIMSPFFWARRMGPRHAGGRVLPILWGQRRTFRCWGKNVITAHFSNHFETFNTDVWRGWEGQGKRSGNFEAGEGKPTIVVFYEQSSSLVLKVLHLPIIVARNLNPKLLGPLHTSGVLNLYNMDLDCDVRFLVDSDSLLTSKVILNCSWIRLPLGPAPSRV